MGAGARPSISSRTASVWNPHTRDFHAVSSCRDRAAGDSLPDSMECSMPTGIGGRGYGQRGRIGFPGFDLRGLRGVPMGVLVC